MPQILSGLQYISICAHYVQYGILQSENKKYN